MGTGPDGHEVKLVWAHRKFCVSNNLFKLVFSVVHCHLNKAYLSLVFHILSDNTNWYEAKSHALC
jgi:hypothetical protein